jgi:hypothetical protein
MVAGMTDWSTARVGMLTALEPSLGPELIQVFDELLPDRPWRESIPAEHWQRAEVRDAVAAHRDPRWHADGVPRAGAVDRPRSSWCTGG